MTTPIIGFAIETPKTESEFHSRTILKRIEVFNIDPKTALAIAKHESRFNPDAMNWNCYYGKKSTFCKPEDRDRAWSVDCGIFQVNVKGKVCPEYMFNVDVNISQFINLYLQRGFQPWKASSSSWQRELALIDV